MKTFNLKILLAFLPVFIFLLLFIWSISPASALPQAQASYEDPFDDPYKFAMRLKAKGFVANDICDGQVEYIVKSVKESCREYPDIDPFMILAVISVESGFRNDLVSTAGACGLMQVVPEYHKGRMNKIGTSQLFGTFSNILVGTDYLNELLQTYGSMDKALRAYNGGPAAIKNDTCHGYARAVNARYRELREAF